MVTDVRLEVIERAVFAIAFPPAYKGSVLTGQILKRLFSGIDFVRSEVWQGRDLGARFPHSCPFLGMADF